ncbi:MAG: Rieske (2Fe-2S) protein [Chloroflexota bacterium]
MGDSSRRPDEGPAFDPRATPVPRRTMLVLMGAGAVVAGGGLGALLAACSGPPVTITLDTDPSWLLVGVPTEVAFTVVSGDGSIPGSTWLVKQATGELVAFDPRCTHGLCRYAWAPEATRFKCRCHNGEYDIDGKVAAGLPPKPLGRFPVREVGGKIVVDVPSDFRTPKESLPA